MAFDLTKHAGAGTENLDSSSSLPVLRILQAQSAEIDKTKKDYALKKIDGAQAGDLVHSQLGPVAKPLTIIPVNFTSMYEQRENIKNGKPIGMLPLSITSHPGYSRGGERNNEEYLTTPYTDESGNTQKRKTRLWATTFMLATLPEHNNALAVMKFQSSQLKTVRLMQGSIRTFRYAENKDIVPPCFARTFIVDTKPQDNADGSWMGYSFTVGRVLDPTADEALLTQAAEAFDKMSLAMPMPGKAPLMIDGTVDVDVTPVNNSSNQRPF